MAFRRKRTNAKKRATKRRSAKRGAKRPALKRMIRREIARNVENKSRQFFQEDDLILGSANALTLDASINYISPCSVTLDILQGTGNGARIGNRITTKRLMYKGTLTVLPYNVSTNPVPTPTHVKMWIFYNREFPTVIPTPATSADFFQLNGSAVGFSNDLVDLWKPVNTDKYRVLAARSFKLGNAKYESNGTTFAASQYYTNNDFKLNCSFSVNLTKMIPKLIRYNDNDADPTTRGLYSLLVAYAADGTAIASGSILAKYSWMLDYTYEDA